MPAASPLCGTRELLAWPCRNASRLDETALELPQKPVLATYRREGDARRRLPRNKNAILTTYLPYSGARSLPNCDTPLNDRPHAREALARVKILTADQPSACHSKRARLCRPTNSAPPETYVSLFQNANRDCTTLIKQSLNDVFSTVISLFPQAVPNFVARVYLGISSLMRNAAYLSLKLSCLYRNSGDIRYSINRRVPVLISTVTAIPGARLTILSSTCILLPSSETRAE
jgi:hypothetical protein